MIRVLLFLILIVGGYALLQHLRRQNPAQRRRLMGRYMLYGLIGLVMILVITGRAHWIAAVAAALIPLLKGAVLWGLRLLPFYRHWQQDRNRVSIINTATICATINHSNGEMNGDILKGPQEGKQLNDMNEDELNALRDYCQDQDPEAFQLLNNYLQWRFSHSQQQEQQQNQQQEQSTSTNSALSKEEALEILGLDESANEDDIVKAHRRLIQKLHPDRGGSDYLAAKINQAKDFLTKN